MKHIFLIVFCFFFYSQVFAQTVSTTNNKTIQSRQNWFVYSGQYKLNPHWGIHAEAQFRTDDDVKFSKQNILRTGLIRYVNPNLNVTAGYAYINTYSAQFNDYATEHRIWEQVAYSHKIKSLNMVHRLRVEQRFVEKLRKDESGNVESDRYVYGNRLRYMNRIAYNFTKIPDATNVFYVALQDEVFFNIAAPDISKSFFDQNRAFLGFGVFHSQQTRLELGYLNQFTNQATGANTMNHIVQVSIIQALNFGK